MSRKIQISYDLKDNKYAGETNGSKSVVHLANIDDEAELLGITSHEVLHAVFDILNLKLTQKQEHYIMKRLEPKWFTYKN